MIYREKILPQDTSNPAPSLIKALRWQLRPLVKLLLKSGITFPFLADLLKEVFVEVAENEFKLPEKEQTDSRINFLTGIHRKDVKRLRNRDYDNEIPEAVSLGSQLVARWIGSDDFLDSEGNPLSLPRLIKQGGQQSFEGLVKSVNKDIRSRAILDEWLNLGVVSLDKEGKVRLNSHAFIPEMGYDEKAWFFGENIHDHLAAAAHNMVGDQPPFLERAVFYDQLSEQSVKELTSMADKSGMRLLNKLNRHAMALQSNDKRVKTNNRRMRFGIYFFSEPEQPNKTEEDTQ